MEDNCRSALEALIGQLMLPPKNPPALIPHIDGTHAKVLSICFVCLDTVNTVQVYWALFSADHGSQLFKLKLSKPASCLMVSQTSCIFSTA